MNEYEKKLKLISNMYYILVGLGVPASFIPWIIMLHVVSPDDKMIVVVFGVFGLLGSFLLLFCLAFAGYAFRKHKWWTYCFVVSIILCPSFPLGTALGVYSIFTLKDPEIKNIFNSNKFASCNQPSAAATG
jgi:FtsH-binding integral membrane protein